MRAYTDSPSARSKRRKMYWNMPIVKQFHFGMQQKPTIRCKTKTIIAYVVFGQASDVNKLTKGQIKQHGAAPYIKLFIVCKIIYLFLQYLFSTRGSLMKFKYLKRMSLRCCSIYPTSFGAISHKSPYPTKLY